MTMPQASEQRQFGRRGVALHGWVMVEGRPRIPCLVRDLSIVGARLDFEVPSWLPYRFRLVVEASRFASECEIKHQRGNCIGVSFPPRKSQKPKAAGFTTDDVDTWKGNP